jgi:putative transposase
MPNHIHFMVEPTTAGSLPKIMMRLTLAYSSYFNRKYGGVGHVWQGRYKSSLIDKENYFIWCGLYVELNPVRAGLVEKPEDWRWSSYNFYAFGKVDSLIGGLIDVDPYYLQLGDSPEERQKGYRQNIEGVMKEKFLEDIREELNQGVFGSPNFITTVKEKFKIRSLKRRGRPRKEEK